MRVRVFPLLILGLLAGCSASGPTQAPPPAATPPAVADRIMIAEQSNLCVSLRIDPRVWPRPLLPNADHDFSLGFAGELGRFHEKTGTLFLPGPRRFPRIVTNERGIDPLCERDAQDIHIIAAYVPRSDGTPFRFTYRIEQGQAAISGAVERDINDEWRTGKLAKLGHVPLQDAIVRDFPERARLILSLIQPE